MKILYYSNVDQLNDRLIPDALIAQGHTVIVDHEKPTVTSIVDTGIEFIISDRARYLIEQSLIEHMQGKIINLHPSFLPWCKGYHPILGGLIENRCLGATIHMIDKTVDTGNILLQEPVWVAQNDTLRTLYDKHREVLVRLLLENIDDLLAQKVVPKPQHTGLGNLNLKRHFDPLIDKLPDSWDTTASWVIENLKWEHR